MPLFTHPDPKTRHALLLAWDLRHRRATSNKDIVKHVDDVWPQFNLYEQTGLHMLEELQSTLLFSASRHEYIQGPSATYTNTQAHAFSCTDMCMQARKQGGKHSHMFACINTDAWVHSLGNTGVLLNINLFPITFFYQPLGKNGKRVIHETGLNILI